MICRMLEEVLRVALAIGFMVRDCWIIIDIPADIILLVENRIPRNGDDTALRTAFKHCSRGGMIAILVPFNIKTTWCCSIPKS